MQCNVENAVSMPTQCIDRHGICQKAYTGEAFKDQILPKSAQISLNARSWQNSVNNG